MEEQGGSKFLKVTENPKGTDSPSIKMDQVFAR